MTTSGPRFYIPALGSVLLFFGLIYLYAREFPILSNTINVMQLVVGSMLAMLLLGAGLLWWFRERLQPWSRHVTEIALVLTFSVLFAPLFGSLLNRGLGKTESQSFIFIAETPYIAMGYGFMKNTSLKPTGYFLAVSDRSGQRLRLRYKKQAYYPITRPGEAISLPVRRGLFGIRVVELH